MGIISIKEYLSLLYEDGLKVSDLAYVKLWTSGRWVGNRTGACVTATL